jgi:hypothetical protein
VKMKSEGVWKLKVLVKRKQVKGNSVHGDIRIASGREESEAMRSIENGKIGVRTREITKLRVRERWEEVERNIVIDAETGESEARNISVWFGQVKGAKG